MDDYLDFSGDDYGSLVDTFVDGDGFGAVESLIWGDGTAEASAVDDALATDGIMGPPETLAGGGSLEGGASGGDGLLSQAEKFLKANPNLAKLGLSGIAGLASAYGQSSASADAIKAKEEAEMRKRQRVSDSITGITPFQVNKPQGLQRLDGSRVFGEAGRIVR